MHLIPNHNASFPYPHLPQGCGLLEGQAQGENLHFSLCNSQHLSPLTSTTTWPWPAWDLVTQCSVPTCHISSTASPLLPAKLEAQALGQHEMATQLSESQNTVLAQGLGLCFCLSTLTGSWTGCPA